MRAERTVPALLDKLMRESDDVDTRANAMYDAGQLHIVTAIPALAAALGEEPLVSETALGALCKFSGEELRGAGLDEDVLARVEVARQKS